MKETGKVFGVLQRVGRAFMLPIAVLPVAGLLLGIGRSLTNETMLRAYHLMKIMGPGTVLYGVIKVGSDCIWQSSVDICNGSFNWDGKGRESGSSIIRGIVFFRYARSYFIDVIIVW